MFTPRSLAYWIMNDGYNSKNGFYLCTESYTLSDNLKLSNILKEKFLVLYINIQTVIGCIYLVNLKINYSH